MSAFDLPPTPEVLQWLSGGQLTNRLPRSQRLYYLLSTLYDSAPINLPQPFRYRDLALRLFAPSHSQSDQAAAAELMAPCQNTTCICQRTGADLLGLNPPPQEWLEVAGGLTGLPAAAIATSLQKTPFAVVHRVLRSDLRQLVRQGWLQTVGRGQFAKVPSPQWPSPPLTIAAPASASLSQQQQLMLMRALEPIAFLQPELEVILEQLWQQTQPQQRQLFQGVAPSQRIFVHLDYILPEEMQEQVDSHQHQIETLWRTPEGGMIQFENWSARQQQAATVTVYPVCLHYARRAKYLSAYGLNPDGNIGWYNYRLDRIRSPQLTHIPWGDARIPQPLQQLYQNNQLPTPDQVQSQLDAAWGFNFYLPKALMILRFSPYFARWYVENTCRHPTFGPIAYGELAALVRSQVAAAEQRAILQVIAQRPATDAYFWGWMRLGDTNVTMRLRDWRPNGEVIAPLPVRRQMQQEAQREVEVYGEAR